jgi:hypothetical protein
VQVRRGTAAAWLSRFEIPVWRAKKKQNFLLDMANIRRIYCRKCGEVNNGHFSYPSTNPGDASAPTG